MVEVTPLTPPCVVVIVVTAIAPAVVGVCTDVTVTREVVELIVDTM